MKPENEMVNNIPTPDEDLIRERLIGIFNEWHRLYENPDEYQKKYPMYVDESYGEFATRTFVGIANELDSKGLIPHPLKNEE